MYSHLFVLALFHSVKLHPFSSLCLSRELTALSRAHWEPMGSTAPLSVVVRTMLSAHLWMGLVLARQVSG